LNERPESWNSYHVWEGDLQYRVLRNEVDYWLGVDERYQFIVVQAIAQRIAATAALFGKQSEETGDGYRTTTGMWHTHGHAPDEHCAALKDVVRSHAYRLDRPLRILEVGTWLGKTAMAMADAIHKVRVHCVDTWEGTPTDFTGKCAEMAGGADNVYAEFLRRIGERKDKTIFPWRKTSAEAAAMSWPDGFDLIFIDAEHTYEALKAQILEWWPHLKDDGVMCGHDLHVHGFDGVVQAVRELFGEAYTAFGFHPQGCLWRVSKADHLDSEKLNGCQLSAR
jgi:predicted O-methyltransferase YrrM